LSAATLYQGNHDRNQKLWIIVSTERYILYIQVSFRHKLSSTIVLLMLEKRPCRNLYLIQCSDWTILQHEYKTHTGTFYYCNPGLKTSILSGLCSISSYIFICFPFCHSR